MSVIHKVKKTGFETSHRTPEFVKLGSLCCMITKYIINMPRFYAVDVKVFN